MGYVSAQAQSIFYRDQWEVYLKLQKGIKESIEFTNVSVQQTEQRGH